MWWKGIVIAGFGLLLAGCSGKQNAADNTPVAQTAAPVVAESPAQQPTSAMPDGAVAVVNGQAILQTDLAERLHALLRRGSPDSPPDEATVTLLRKEALEALMNQVLLAQQAQAQQIVVTDEEFQQRVRQVQAEYQGQDIQTIVEDQGMSFAEWERAQRADLLLEKLIVMNTDVTFPVTDEEVQQYYDEHKDKYDQPAQIRASQILTYDKAVAEQALQAIRGGADFAQIAKTYSQSADAGQGGDLGFFTRGVMPPEFDAVLFALNIGEVSHVVQTPYGYQIFTLTGQRDAYRVSADEARTQITTILQHQKRMAAADRWIAELRENAKILLNHERIQQVK